MKPDKERLIYHMAEAGEFVGRLVNVSGVAVHGKTMDELKHKAKTIGRMALSHMTEVMSQDDPFELVEEKDLEVYLHGQHADALRELQRYKDTFGDLPEYKEV